MKGKAKRVLVAPLDWGLGHATRCIPIINELKGRGAKIFIASSGNALVLLKQELPNEIFIELPSYKARYTKRIPFFLTIFLQLPKFLLAIWKEHRQLKKIITEYSLTHVISDNRYGCWTRAVPCFFITHQVNILFPQRTKAIEAFINYFNHQQIKKFSQCWIPDEHENCITGKLTNPSHHLKPHFIGILSRFSKKQITTTHDLLILLSGPEPQRTILEHILTRQISKINMSAILVRGLPGTKEKLDLPGIEVKNHLSGQELEQVIAGANLVVCRSGYSSIMDLIRLQKKAIFIPTPGQTEQEYLAKELKRKMIAFCQYQDKVDLNEAIKESKNYKGFEGWKMRNDLLSKILDKSIFSE